MENVTDRSQSIIIDSYIEYYSRVVDFITYRINNRCDAEDLAQDVFIRLMEYKQILCEDTVKHFIYTISRNIVTDYLRRYYKAREISSYLYDETSSACTNETEETVLVNDISSLEKKKLATFPRQRKQIYYLTRFKGLSSVEIATRLNVGKRTVECHLFMARKEMRTYLQQCI